MRYLFCIAVMLLFSCNGKTDKALTKNDLESPAAIKISPEERTRVQDYFEKAWRSGMYSPKYQVYLDSALMIKPDSAYLWQQKAMPLYKARKYTIGKSYLKKAVTYDSIAYLDYSGFMKCIFSKEYEESIEELLAAKKLFGDGYVMDHTYNFYIGLSNLQLNRFNEAKKYLVKSKEQQFLDFPNAPPEEACHYLDWFYLGIVEMELQRYETAIGNFDMALKVYKNFGDAMYYKAYCQRALNLRDEARSTFEMALRNKHNTINEDNVFYEVYPYQFFHGLSPMTQSK